VNHPELIPRCTVGRPDELHSESGLELRITDLVRVLGSPCEKEHLIKLEETKVWDWMSIPGVIITPDPVVHGAIATSRIQSMSKF